jgi:hypothetical protein
VTSAGLGVSCNEGGFSGRVSAVYESFVVPFINNAPGGPGEGGASNGAASSSSVASSGAGGAGVGGGGLAPGGGGQDDGWVAGSLEDQDYDGDAVSGCAVARATPARHAWLWLLSLVLWWRRRRGANL